MKNITRNTVENCVMARIMRQGTRHQKNFTIAQYKTWEAAEAKAARWIKLVSKKLPPEVPREGRMTKSNTSGIVGVFSQKHVVHKEAHSLTYYRWVARWPKCPLRGGVAWYISENKDISDDDAFVLATLSLKLKSANRDEIMAAFRRAKRDGEYERIVSTKKHDAAPKRSARSSRE